MAKNIRVRPFMDYGIGICDCGGMLRSAPDFPKFSGPIKGRGRIFNLA